MVDWRTLTDFQRDLLEVILDEADYEAPQSGQQLKTALEPYRGAAVNHGRLYPNLDALIAHGLVAKEELDGRTNGYTPTAAGVSLYCERDERTSRVAAQYDREGQRLIADGGDGE